MPIDNFIGFDSCDLKYIRNYLGISNITIKHKFIDTKYKPFKLGFHYRYRSLKYSYALAYIDHRRRRSVALARSWGALAPISLLQCLSLFLQDNRSTFYK